MGSRNVFISYAHEDSALREELAKHLAVFRQQGLISDWHDRQLRAGETWKEEIERNLQQADVVLMLVSPDFLASHFCMEVELKGAIGLRDKGAPLTIIPIILRPCDWEHSNLSLLQVLPEEGKPVTSWLSRDEAFTNIVKGLRRALTQKSQPSVTLQLTTPAGSSALTKSAVLIEHGRNGRGADVDFLMKNLPANSNSYEQQLADYSLSLVDTSEGRARICHYLKHGDAAQQLAAAFYLKMQSGTAALERVITQSAGAKNAGVVPVLGPRSQAPTSAQP